MSSAPLTIADFETLARQRMEPTAYDYYAGAAGDELTATLNCRAFDRLLFRPHVLVDTSRVDMSTTVLGERLALPILLAGG